MTAANPDDPERFYGSPPPAKPADPPAGAPPRGPRRDPDRGYSAPGPGPGRDYSNYGERAPEPTRRFEAPYAERAPEPTKHFEAPYAERAPERSRRHEPPDEYAAAPTGSLPPPPRKRRRWGLRLGIVLGILVVLLVAADRVGVVIAERTAATKVQQEQGLPQKPSIGIDGFPFLTQVANHDFSHVTVDIRGLEPTGVPITDLHADLYGVHVDSSFNGGTADTVDATAQLSYSDISAAVTKEAGVGQVTVAEGTGGQLKASFGIAGVNVSATVAVTLAGPNTIKLTTGQVQTPLSGFGISIPDTSGFTVSIPLGTLPFGIQLTGIQTTANYVGITATGHNVPLQQSSSTG